MRELRPLPMAHTGHPAPFRLGAPAYLVALSAWVAATFLLVAAAPDLAATRVSGPAAVGAAHAIGVVFFPFAVAAAVWQLLPVMLRNDPPFPAVRWVVLPLLAAGAPLAFALATDRRSLATFAALLLGGGLVLLIAELGTLVRRAPAGRTLVVSRVAVALAAVHAVAAFAVGVVALLDDPAEPLGIPYERLLVVHLALALVGWLTLLIANVGRTLVPMLGLAAAAPRRRVPVAELVAAAGLWVLVAGVGAERDLLVAAGVLVTAAGLAAPARRFVVVAARGTIGFREGPVAHVAVGLACLAEGAVLILVEPGRRTAVAAVLLVGVGWAAGVVLGHLGKLISLSAWGSWPPGPRPKQAELYPRRLWQLESALFAVGVQALVAGVALDAAAIARSGAVVVAAAAIVALAAAVDTVLRVRRLGAAT